MDTLIKKLKSHLIEVSQNQKFVHHDWFIDYHLSLVEKIALELCEIYQDADRDVVLVLVWIHDYAKILDKEHEHDEAMYEKGREKLLEIGFEREFVDKVIEYLSLFEKKMEIDLHDAPIEVKIASSADGASHLVGPFQALFFRENSNKSIEELIESNKKKLNKDWERKIVLPEVKAAFEKRYKLMKEQTGEFPEHFIM